jgi:glutamine amidotransferase
VSELVAVIDYGSGNLRSAEKAIARAILDGGLNARVLVTNDAETVWHADRIVLPGVGAFADCMSGLSALPGMVEVLEECVRKRGRPFLGICVGMQLMASVGREHGDHKGLGWIDGEVVRLAPRDPALKIPHMGWNELVSVSPHPVTAHLAESDAPHAYFVHSFEFRPSRAADICVETEYGGRVAALIARDTMVGTQFHPEKSQATGLMLLQNFVRWRP